MYEKLTISNDKFLILLKGNYFIECVSLRTDSLKTFNFKTEAELEEFVNIHKE